MNERVILCSADCKHRNQCVGYYSSCKNPLVKPHYMIDREYRSGCALREPVGYEGSTSAARSPSGIIEYTPIDPRGAV